MTSFAKVWLIDLVGIVGKSLLIRQWNRFLCVFSLREIKLFLVMDGSDLLVINGPNLL